MSDPNDVRHAPEVVPLPEPGTGEGGTSAATYRRARRRSRLTAAALIVGSGAAAVTLAYDVLPAGTPLAGTASTAGVGTTSVVQTNGGPRVAHTVATTSASGVTTTTTTRVVNGKPVVTTTTSGAVHHDS